jgi:hypothetical protein
MRRRFAALASLLALAGGAGALAQQDKPPLKAALEACQTGSAPGDRYAVFSGSMPTQSGAATLAMRFDLSERTPQAGAFTHVTLPKWGIWERTTRPGVPGFIFVKRVDQLAAPAAYRAVVSFRWYDAKGKLLRAARRVSATCREPDPRPDLHVRRIAFEGGKAHVVVRNRGRGAAPRFDVSATFGSGAGTSRAVDPLPPGAQATLTFPAGRCTPGATATIVLDPSGAVDEADETDDTVTVPCPSRRR